MVSPFYPYKYTDIRFMEGGLMVTDQSSGLRFDIYERIMLSEEAEGIQQLDEIELIPQIQLTTQDEKAILKGNLLLKGKYLGGEDQRSSRNLEHSIPVEITLPMERIHDLENIGVEIENFDVDLLSSHNLNVTGVLSLKGVDTNTSSSRKWDGEEDEEEFVFVHQADEARDGTESQDLKEEAKDEQRLNSKSEALESSEEISTESEGSEEHEEAEEAEKVEEDEKELKIAFNSQKAEDSKTDFKLKNLDSKLHSQKTEEPTDLDPHEERTDPAPDSSSQAEESLNADEQKDIESANSDTEWKNLFLNREGEEQQQFSKMRMCIVQKQETLDTIAERYSLNPREIVLYNRLNDQDVAEGQIIYIPN
jgi:stage VI sporulation protein D